MLLVLLMDECQKCLSYAHTSSQVHFHAQSIKASPVTIVCKTAKLFTDHVVYCPEEGQCNTPETLAKCSLVLLSLFIVNPLSTVGIPLSEQLCSITISTPLGYVNQSGSANTPLNPVSYIVMFGCYGFQFSAKEQKSTCTRHDDNFILFVCLDRLYYETIWFTTHSISS